MPKRSRGGTPPPPAYLDSHLLTPTLRTALLTCRDCFGGRLGHLRHATLTIVADALNQSDRIEEELEARRQFEIGLLGKEGHLAARDYADQDRVARAQNRHDSAPLPSKSAARAQEGSAGRCEVFDVKDPLFSLYINAMAFTIEGEIRAGERFCKERVKQLPLLLRLELRELQQRDPDSRPNKKAKTDASSPSDHAPASDRISLASLPDSSPPPSPFADIIESSPGSEDGPDKKGDDKDFADQQEGSSSEHGSNILTGGLPPPKREPPSSSPEPDGVAKAADSPLDGSISPLSKSARLVYRSAGVDSSSRRAEAVAGRSSSLPHGHTSSLNEHSSRPTSSSSGVSDYVPTSETNESSSVSAPSSLRRNRRSKKKPHAPIKQTLPLFDLASSSSYAESGSQILHRSSTRESSPLSESPESLPSVPDKTPSTVPDVPLLFSTIASASSFTTQSKTATKGKPKANRNVPATRHPLPRLGTHGEVQHKPSLPIKAPVWAMHRQELCEALPYYRAYQSGLYKKREVPYGYLLDGHGSPRDIWAQDGRVIISHGGGKSVQSLVGDGMALRDDQTDSDAPIRALINARNNRIPVVLIVGSKYSLLPWKLDYTYGVLGWYWISYSWVEGEYPTGSSPPGKCKLLHRYKFRFDWIKGQGTPWWAAASQPSSPLSSCPGSESESSGTPTSPTDTSIMTPTTQGSPELPPTRQRGKLDDVLIGSLLSETSEDENVYRVTFSTALASRTVSNPTDHVRTWAKHMAGLDHTTTRAARPLPGSRMLSAAVKSIDGGRTMPETHSSVTRHICSKCLQASLKIFKEAWTCLNPKCEDMWKIPISGLMQTVPANFELTYSNAFLDWMKSPGSIRIPYDVRPPSWFEQFPGVWGAWRTGGWVCRRCGRANLRSAWNVLRCEGCAKGLRLSEQLSPGSLPAEWWEELKRVRRTTQMPLPTYAHRQLFGFQTLNWPLPTGQGEVRMFVLPQHVGSIMIIRPNKVTTANRILGSYIGSAAIAEQPLFERSILQSNKSGGRMLSQYFSLNSGEPYKYCAKSNSLPFKDSPNCVLEARDHMVSLIHLATGRAPHFNEVLSVIYAEGQKMNWHDDGEKGVGPYIASLSLGSPAQMSWRRKAPAGDPGRKGPVDLTITLEHGDVMIMRGHEIQRQYDHRVEPFGFRIAATARFIESPPAPQKQRTMP